MSSSSYFICAKKGQRCYQMLDHHGVFFINCSVGISFVVLNFYQGLYILLFCILLNNKISRSLVNTTKKKGMHILNTFRNISICKVMKSIHYKEKFDKVVISYYEMKIYHLLSKIVNFIFVIHMHNINNTLMCYFIFRT